ncbi:uncharacterized protein At3g49055 [Argentina anserina]|uniref:uncharacterized protein At3g49055 n=1 Tax=Argentina anserina TaxID=57926 RepID=UPI0021762A4A|nr:uncharacterized protein At3g49055 [Potentilla anserina]XP_050385420.1 uncharacterized protein At3g49055 [Potentilla anserina]
METETQIKGPDSPTATDTSDHDHLLRAELESLRHSHRSLQQKTAAMEERHSRIQTERDDAAARNSELTRAVGEASGERDALREEVKKLEADSREREDEWAMKIDEEVRRKKSLEDEVRLCRERIEKLEMEERERDELLMKCSDSIGPIREELVGIIEGLCDEQCRIESEAESESGLGSEEEGGVWGEIMGIKKLVEAAGARVEEYKEIRHNERRQLGNSVVSLTEENRDISALLRIALVEKEAVEKRLKGGETKRVAILQRVGLGGFGFLMGSGGSEQGLEGKVVEGMGSGASSKSDSSECEEEVVSLASTVEKIMKNLRLEITQLRRSLEESRSDTERLQTLTEKQTQQIAENMLYIKELEDRERVLTENVEAHMSEMKDAEAEVARWREACELEVEAGKNEIEEREKLIAILKKELEKTRAALDISNGKLKLKEELAANAMAAHAAAEKSLQLADSRAAGLRNRIEELSRQLEEAESRERHSRRVRHICWPWRALKVNPANNSHVRRLLPEMQAMLNYNG